MARQRAGFMGAGNPLSLKLLARMPFRRKAATIDRMRSDMPGRSHQLDEQATSERQDGRNRMAGEDRRRGSSSGGGYYHSGNGVPV